jgi:hypothetical protein
VQVGREIEYLLMNQYRIKTLNTRGNDMKNKYFLAALKAVFFLALFLMGAALNTNLAKAAVSEIKAVTIKTGNEDLTGNTYAGMMTATGDDGYVRGSVVKVTTDCSGLLRFHYQGDNSDLVSLTVYSDEARSKDIAYVSLESSSDVVTSSGLAIPGAGTYYVTVMTFEEDDVAFTIAADIYSSDDDSLSDGKSKVVTLLSEKDTNYYEITLKSAGTVKVYTTYANGKECYVDTAIYKKVGGKMSLISEGSYLEPVYVTGLAKGTYYIGLSNGSDSYYSIEYKYTSVIDKSGAKKSDAAAITLGKASKGLVLTTDKTSKEDWYKVTLKKDQSVTVTLTGEVSGSVTLSFYDSDSDLFGKLYVDEYNTEDSAVPYVEKNKSKKLTKGTYYIKVTKADKGTSGSYTIKLK